MAGANRNEATLRTDLMTLVEELDFSELGLAADIVAPKVMVPDVAGAWPVLPRESVGKIPDTRRQSDGSFPRGEWDWSSDSYNCVEYGFEMPVDKTQAQRNRKYINEEVVSASLAKQGVLLARENRVAKAVFNTTTFADTNTNRVNVVNEWDDAANATPFADIEQAARMLTGKAGIRKAHISVILPTYAVDKAVRTDEIRADNKYTQNILITPRATQLQFLAQFWGVKEVVEVASLYDTTGLGVQSSFGEMWSDTLGMVCVREASAMPSMMNRSVAVQPTWSEYAQDILIEDYPHPETRSHVYRALEYRGIKVRTEYGVLLNNLKTA